MEVSVESLEGLKRRIHVSIPTERLEQAVEKRLRQLVHEVRLDGFRPGKVPLQVVRKRYEVRVRYEVAQDLMEATFQEAVSSQKLSPVSSPSVDVLHVKPHEDFRYAMSFEVLPEFTIRELTKKTTITWIVSQITPQDIDEMIETLRQQNKTWEKVNRAVQTGDQVLMDFKGFIDKTPIESAQAQHFEVEIGRGQLIPGFEEALIGHHAAETFDITITFPQHYHDQQLMGKEATFKIVLHEVRTGHLPALDADFVKSLNIQSGELHDLKKDLQQHMERQLTRKLNVLHREACFDALLQANPFELPEGLIKKELAALKHDMYHRLTGHQHTQNEKIPDFPDELFVKSARRRVHLGLLCSAYVQQQGFIAKAEDVEKMIERYAQAYTDPDEFKTKCRQDKHQLAEIESMVVEEMMVDAMKEQATVKEQALDYQAAIHYKLKEDY